METGAMGYEDFCGWCGQEFFICGRDFRGQVHCSKPCRAEADAARIGLVVEEGVLRLAGGDEEVRPSVVVVVACADALHVAPQLDARLARHPTTLSPADLLLTKLQVAAPDPKDLRDAVALIHQHPLASDADGDVLGLDRLVEVTSADWGWWTTFTDNLERVPGTAAVLLEDASGVEERCGEIFAAVEQAPKGLRWRARAKVGRRVPWREEPEEHGAGIHG